MTISALLAIAGCKKDAPKSDFSIGSMLPKGAAKFFVNPAFPGADSVMIAARRVFPESGHITLGDFFIGSDAVHDYAVFFAGRESKVGFERTYWRYLIFVKKKTARDWSTARVFDWPDNRTEPFNGPIALLESKGTELGTTSNK